VIITYRSIPGRALYKQLEKHLEDRGYQEPWKRYEIITDIDEKLRQNEMPAFPYLVLGLHGGIEPVEEVVFALHRRIFNSRVFLIKYFDVRLEDRVKSHEMESVPFLYERMADFTISVHAMPDEWLERKIAVGGLPKETPIKLALIEQLKSFLPLGVIIADGKNGFKERLVEGSSYKNPVNYTCRREGIQIEFPAFLLTSRLYDQKIIEAILNTISIIKESSKV